MKITVINGTEKHGVTYRLKEIFLSEFKGKAVITEYYLPKDCPDFCIGCTNCLFKGEQTCKDADKIGKIEKSLLEADLIVMTMKVLLDHFAYRWMPHRPMPAMFGKRAVIITQCAGSGAKSAAKDMKDSLSWWGISKIGIFAEALREEIVWEKLSKKKQAELTEKIRSLAQKFAYIDYTKPARTNLLVKVKFSICRMMQKSLHKENPEYLDSKYWAEQGWLGCVRPWK